MALDETYIAAQTERFPKSPARLTLLADRELLRLTEYWPRKKFATLTTQLARDGNATQLVCVWRIALRSAEINRAAYTRRLRRDRNARIALLGQPLTPELSRRLNGRSRLRKARPDHSPGGLPSDLLRRPDIRRQYESCVKRG